MVEISKEKLRVRRLMKDTIRKRMVSEVAELDRAIEKLFLENMIELWEAEDKGDYIKITIDPNALLPQYVIIRHAFSYFKGAEEIRDKGKLPYLTIPLKPIEKP